MMLSTKEVRVVMPHLEYPDSLSSSDLRNENTPKIHFSATPGEEPTAELRLA